MKKTFEPFQLFPHVLELRGLHCNSLLIVPQADRPIKTLAIFTHGFTASKADVLPWAARLLDLHVASVVFDLPGHWLGSFHEVDNWENFLQTTPELFWLAQSTLEKKIRTELGGQLEEDYQIIMGGHSLGALLSIHSAHRSDAEFRRRLQWIVAVGFGLNTQVKTHLFESDLYQKTLHLRGQLVSPQLSHQKVLRWVREQKENLPLENKRVYLLSGKDDAVVGADGAEILREKLATKNEVLLDTPEHLPHHRPELAAAHIYHFAKKHF